MTVSRYNTSRGIFTLLFLGAIFLILSACGGPPEGDSSEVETVSPIFGDISSSATATGQIASLKRAELATTSQGIIDQVYVRVGQTVSAGEVLVELDPSDYELNVANAAQSLALREADLAQLVKPATVAEIASAEANLASAIARLENLQSGPDELEIAIAETDIQSAEASISSAQAGLSSSIDSVTPADIEAAKAELVAAENNLENIQNLVDDLGEFVNKTISDQLADAQNSYNVALAKYNRLLSGANSFAVGASAASVNAAEARLDQSEANLAELLVGTSAADLAAAEASVASANATLQQLLEEPSEAEIAVVEAQIEQARIALADAEAALEETELVAPFGGIITALNAVEGELGTGVLVEMADDQDLEIVLNVDEIDISAISLDQEALITLETWPDQEIAAFVSSIAPTAGSTTSGIVSYDVHLTLEQTDLPVRLGMTANANLLTSRREDVLLVPNRAIISERSTGKFFVNLEIDEETVERTEVIIGLRDSEFTQIIDGVDEGDSLLVNYQPPTFDFGGGGPFGGGDEE